MSLEKGVCAAQICNLPCQNTTNICELNEITSPTFEDYCCTACRSDLTNKSPAVGQCLTCSSLLCRACVFAHKFMICFQGHTVVPISTTTCLTEPSFEPHDNSNTSNENPVMDGYASRATNNSCKIVDDEKNIISQPLECQNQLNDLIANLGLNENAHQQVQHQTSTHPLLRQSPANLQSREVHGLRYSLQFNNTSVVSQDNSKHRNNPDLLLLLEKAGSALQIQHWRAALKINETINFFKDELDQKKQNLLKSLDEAYDMENRKLLELSREVRANLSSIDTKLQMEIARCCEQLLNNAIFFEYVRDYQSIKRSVQENCGQLKLRQLFDTSLEKISQWSADTIGSNLTSGYSSLSLSQNSNLPSYIYPISNSSDLSNTKRHSSFVPESSQDQTSLTNYRSDIGSPWSLSDNACYWLQDPCWNSDNCSLFSANDAFHTDIRKSQGQRFSELAESPVQTSSKGSIEMDDPPMSLSPGGLQGRYTDLATCSIQSSDPSLSVGSCCCGNRPISSIRRQKMVYHCKFGEFGGLDSQFTEPSGVAVNLQSDIIVADTNNHRIQIFDRDGRYKFRFGECGKRDGQLLYPNRVAVFKLSGDIVVTERSPTHQVQIFNQNGNFVRKFGSTVLQHPRGVCVDPSGNIIVAECKVMRVFVFDRFGNAISRFNCSKHLEFPNSVCANDKQEIFISDNRAHCVKVFSYDGRLIRTLGGEGITNFPIGVGLDSSSNVLVADNHNNFNLTLFSQSGQLLAALESKVKHAQCFDAAIMDSCGSVVLSSKDYHIYIYRYMPVSYFPPDVC